MTIQDLAESLAMNRTTLTRNLHPLETRGWLSITEGEDRRTRWITVTELGENVLEQALPLWKKAQSETEKVLGNNEWANLLRSLEKLEGLSE